MIYNDRYLAPFPKCEKSSSHFKAALITSQKLLGKFGPYKFINIKGLANSVAKAFYLPPLPVFEN